MWMLLKEAGARVAREVVAVQLVLLMRMLMYVPKAWRVAKMVSAVAVGERRSHRMNVAEEPF